MLKKILPILLLCFAAKVALAQSYHNDWIDYSKTYYKFKIGPFGYDIVNAPIKKGVVRINQPALASAGLASIPSEQFQLWRNGTEVPVYISKASGTLSPTDFIEFWGEIEDGKPDKDLYRDSLFQLSDYWSLETDSSTYFLTANSLSSNMRLRKVSNDVNSTLLLPEKNFLFTVGRYYRAGINEGYGIFAEKNLYLSSYDTGEGWSSRPVRPDNCGCGQPHLPQSFPRLFLDTTGPALTVGVNMVGNSPNQRNMQVFLNSALLTQFTMDYFKSAKVQLPGIAANTIKNDTGLVIVQNLSGVSNDEMRVANIELTYPRKFNFGNASNFEFYLPHSGTGRYLKITNFSTNSVPPVLYDVTNGKRYIGNISITDTIRFLLKPSSQVYHLILVRGDGSTATVINGLEQRNFTDFSKTGNQGDYLIISNPSIYGNAPNNYVDQYRLYRRSAKGGSYNAKLINIHELEDQFAFGIKMHPLAIKNFLRYARNEFAIPPAFVFIIGKGSSYSAYRPSGQNPLIDQLNLVPVYGSPGSDNLLSSNDYDPQPATPIGRLSAVSPSEVGIYLSKVKQYDSAQLQKGTNNVDSRLWMKNVLQLTGANDQAIGTVLDTIALKYKNIIADTLFGANVTTYSKTGDPAGYPEALANFENTFNNGCSLLEYFGHSSSTNLDFSLDDPANYKNTGRYPLFIVNGCLAGNIFDFDPNRFTIRSTISEKFILEPQKGAIAYLSTSSYGVLTYLDVFTKQFYKAIAKTEYGKSLGEITQEGIGKGFMNTGPSDFYGRMHAEQYTLHGDPALKMNGFEKPDYDIEAKQSEISPSFISVADSSFTITIPVYNLGRASGDTVHFSLFQKLNDGDSVLVFAKKLSSLKALDSFIVKMPIIPDRDKGILTFSAYIDDNNKVDELSEKNNIALISVNISSAEIRPIFPYNYAIVVNDVIDLSASTADPFDTSKKYVLEMDTTALFNSPSKIILHKVSKGGVVQFLNVPLSQNNRVYYWRVAPQSVAPHWNMFSFIHKKPGSAGSEQAHYFQHTESAFDGIELDSSRQFKFAKILMNLFVRQAVYGTSGFEDNDFSVSVNGSYVASSACVGHSVIFNIFDPLTFKSIANTTNPYGAAPSCKPLTKNDFEFSTTSSSTRKNAMDFLDNFVNAGYYVVVRKIYDDGADNGIWAPTVWRSDTALYGHNNSLYHRFKDQGLLIDSFNHPRTFLFVFRKNDSTDFKPISVFSKGVYDVINFSENIVTSDTTGSVTSPVFGPGKAWKNVTWNGIDLNGNNTAQLNVIGINANGIDSVFYTLTKQQHLFDISGISAAKYPFVKLRMNTRDSITVIPYQLQDWSVEYTPVAEGAVAPNLGISIPKTLSFDHGINISFDTLQGYVVFKNVSNKNFDSLKLKLILYDDNNLSHQFSLPKTRPLPAGDTLHVSFLVNVTALPEGKYNLFLDVNADKAQPEQFYFNNLLYKYLQITRTGFTAASEQQPVRKENIGNDNKVKVYPNPFNNLLHISENKSGNVKSTVRLFEVSGKQLMQQTFEGNISLDVSALAAGTYLVQVDDGTIIRSFKVQKQKR